MNTNNQSYISNININITASNDNITHINDEHLITLITGYWRIDDHYHSIQTYQKYMSFWVPWISTPMVILTNDKFFANYVNEEKIKNKNLSNTILIHITAEELFTFKPYFETYRRHQETMNISKWNPLLAVIYNAKIGLLHNLSLWNPFNSEYFAWFDIGALRWYHDTLFSLANNSYEARLWPSPTIVRNTFLQCPDCILFAVPKPNVVQAGFIIGNKHAIKWVNTQFYKTHNFFIEHNIYVNKEENIMQMMVFNFSATSHILLLNGIGSSKHCKWWHWMYFQLYFTNSNACQEQRMQCIQQNNNVMLSREMQNFRYIFRPE